MNKFHNLHCYTTSLIRGFTDSSVDKESACDAGDPGLIPGSGRSGKIPWRKDRLPTPVFWGFSCGSAGKESTCNAEDLGSIAGLGRSPGEGKGYPYPLHILAWRIPWTVYCMGHKESDPTE